MQKFFKENWFLVLVAVLFLGITVYYGADASKNAVRGKTVDGKQVVFSIDDKNVTIDEFYDKLDKSYGASTLKDAFYKMVLAKGVSTTEEMQKDIDQTVENLVKQYADLGYDESYLNNLTKQYYGFDTYREYVTYTKKEASLLKDYIKAHTEIIEELKERSPRVVRYVVILTKDVENLTEEESAKLKAAQDDWANGMDFEELAKKHSQDSNAENGGLFGYIDNQTTNIDETFLEAALSLKTGETTEWITSSSFGYFLIKCETSDINEMLDDSGLLDQVVNLHPGLRNTIILEAAEKLEINYANEEIENIIKGGF